MNDYLYSKNAIITSLKSHSNTAKSTVPSRVRFAIRHITELPMIDDL